MHVTLHASATDCPFPKFALLRLGWSPPRADDPDRPRLLHDDLIALSSLPRTALAARLVVGPDGGAERYGVGSEVDGGHHRCSPGPRFCRRASSSPLKEPHVRIPRQPLVWAHIALDFPRK